MRTDVSIEEVPAPDGLGLDAGQRGLTLQEVRRLGLRPIRNSVPSAWPPEPPTPPDVGLERFQSVLAQLCPPGSETAQLAEVILDSATSFDVDPFLLAALIYQQSRCDSRESDAYGIGLARINPGMFARGMRPRAYLYGAPGEGDEFVATELPLGRYPFTPAALRAAAPNAYFAAALLHVFSRQCPAIDERFDSVPHRHFVSHFIWGDRVRGTLPEDEILIARRRLLQYYAPYSQAPSGAAGSIELTSPLDGAPRLVIGVMGDPRDAGRRIHLGIDLSAAEGEPIRAIAAGVVTFAGADLRNKLVSMEPAAAERARSLALGPRGLFVKVQHADGVESLYAHLADYRVREGQHLEPGDVLGRVGRSGVHASDAHLHLGVFVDGLPIDPLPLLRAFAVRAAPTMNAHAVMTRP